jgi:beta-galactosidase
MNPTTDISRRGFLKSIGLTAAAVIVPDLAANVVNAAGETERPIVAWEYHPHALGGIWEVWRGDKVGDGAEAHSWQPVEIPHCFNAFDAVDPDATYYQGPGWYRVHLELANPFPGGRTLLHFEGAGQRSDVFVGLDRVRQHVGGYDEFSVDITDTAAKFVADRKSSQIPVAVLCDNSPDLEMIPSGLSDFNRYGGLYRHVHLVYTPAVSLERVLVAAVLRPDGSGNGSIRARLYNPRALSDPVEISVRVFDPAGEIHLNRSQTMPPWNGEAEIAAFRVARAELWSPAKPALYLCEVTLSGAHGTKKVSERFGFRHFEFVDHGPFKLNGERLLLRGTHRHEDHARLGAAVTDDITRQEFRLIKEMGANFIRLAHYQQSRLVLDLCDELGLLVWEEIPWCRGGLGGEAYQNQARNMLRAMIDQHRNHPSVILWGLGDENDWPGDFPEFDAAKIRAFMSELNQMAHQLDSSRKTALRRCDFCKDIVDVYSPSIWPGWYYDHYTAYADRLQKETQTVNHFLHMEWGAESHAGRHSEGADLILAQTGAGAGNKFSAFPSPAASAGAPAKTGDWSETYACDLFDWYLKEQEATPWLAGAAQWAFKDFATPLRLDNPIPHVNQKGLVERDLTLKEGYYVFQSYWAEKPMVHIYGHSRRVRWGEPQNQKLVKVYSNCDTAELFLNGVSCGVKQRHSQDFPAAGLRWTVEFKPGENHLLCRANKKDAIVTDEIRFQYQTSAWGKPSRLELKETARDADSVTVTARLLDAQGLLCLDARNPVRFGLAGDGTLLANIGTSRGSRAIELCNGSADISLHRNGGTSMLAVRSKGVSPAFLRIE